MGDDHPEDQALFVTERCCLSNLVEGLASPCPCGLTIKPWALESVIQVRISPFIGVACGRVELLVYILERACVARAIFLPPLPSAKGDLVKLESAQWTVPS